MKPIRSTACGPLVLSLSLLALPAMADDDCEAPTRKWQPREAVMQMAAQQGWQVEYREWDGGQPERPRRVFARQGGATVRLVVDAWGPR